MDSVPLRSEQVGTVKNLHVIGDTYLAGQPGAEDFKLLKERGVTRVINLRTEGEVGFDEAAVVGGLGMEYHHVPFSAPETLTDKVFDRVRELLKKDNGAVLLHCGSANRVGAVWLAKRVLDDKAPYEQALREAQEVGLKTPGLIERARAYIEEHPNWRGQ